MAFIIALLLIAIFTGNVAMGAVSGTPPLGNVAEMLMLLTASVAFVVGILRREARDKGTGQSAGPGTEAPKQ